MLTYRNLIAGIFTFLLLTACATTYIKPSSTTNPPPSQQFSSFSTFELMPIEVASQYRGQEANEKAVAKIQEHLNQNLSPILNNWKQNSDEGGRTLIISPQIEHIKFIGGGARFWAGALAGSSAVIMKVRYQDKASGQIIAEPEFFQRAAAMSGAWTIGGQDNAMLERVANLVTSYTQDNYESAVGGPTGAPEDLVE